MLFRSNDNTHTHTQSQIMSLTNAPEYVSSTVSSSPEGTLLVGETATYTANFTVDQLAFDNSGVQNAIQFTGSSPGNTDDVTDISDDGIDREGLKRSLLESP